MKILLNIEETCSAVSLSASTIKRLMLEGRFPDPVRVGGRVLWRAVDLQQWAEQLAGGGLPETVKKRGRKRLAA